MERRRFGNYDLEVPAICFGTMRFASKQRADDDASRAGKRALEAAIERGIDFVHSSYEYGTRWAVGDVLAHHPKRDQVRHAIKVNVPDWGVATFDRAAFRKQIEDALRELHADRIDLVQHLQRGNFDKALGYDDRAEAGRVAAYADMVGPLADVVAELREEGLVGAVASFPYTVGYARAVIESGAFDGIVAYFNAIETEMAPLFPLLRERGLGFVGIRPLMGGLLTDRRINRSVLPEGDRMREPTWDRAYDQLAEVRQAVAATERPDSWTDFALRFSVSDPTITSTVVGINSVEHLDRVFAALDAPLPSAQLVARLDAINNRFRAEHSVRADGAGVPIYAPTT